MALKLYKAYNFRNKDPVIDELRTIIQDTYGTGNKATAKAMSVVVAAGGPSETAMRGWFYGKTRRPQSASIEACGRALGMKRIWVRVNDKEK